MQYACYNVQDHEGVGQIDHHVHGFPPPWGEEAEPEIMAGARHDCQNQQCKESQDLEWEEFQGEVMGIAEKQRAEDVGISSPMKPQEAEDAMASRQQEHADTHMSPVI